MATPSGFEPKLSGPKPLVLPLHHGVFQNIINIFDSELFSNRMIEKTVEVISKLSSKWATHGAQMRWKRIEPWRPHGEIRFLMQVCARLSPFR